MLFLRGRWPRVLPSVGLVSFSALALGCLQEPPPDYSYNELDAAGEVFRVFCKRAAKYAHPEAASGDQFVDLCDGDEAKQPVQPADDENGTLKTLIGRRPVIIAALRQTFGEMMADGSPLIDAAVTYDDNELSKFLSSLVPYYDKPDEIIPTTTRDIAALFDKVIDPNDDRASKVIDTMARLSARVGYRPAQLNLGSVRPILSYENLDTLADQLLGVVAKDGSAHQQWLNVLSAAALELADEPVPVPDPTVSTLKYALDLLYIDDDGLKDPTSMMTPNGVTLAGSSGPLPVLMRDDTGTAMTTADASGVDPLPTPFLIPDRDDGGQSRDSNTLALATNGKPLFQTMDANQTILAAAMRETSKLIDRGSDDRSSLENIAHGLKPLLGPYGDRTLKIGSNNYAFQGPNIDNSPMLEFLNSLLVLARYPETQSLIKLLTQLLQQNESEATAAVYGGLAINDRSKMHPEAKLNGPHEFWDDLIDAGNQILLRPGLLQALIETFTDPIAPEQGPLFANWMIHNDVVTYKGAPIVIDPPAPYTDQQKADINAPVVQPLMQLVDRTMPDTSMNRSIWQRTMSLIYSLNGVKVCNKKGAILNVPTTIGLFTFPLGNAAGYDECGLIEFEDAVEVYSQAILGTAKVVLKDDIATGLAALGGGLTIVPSVPDITEQQSQLTGFRDTITPQSTARFIFAPRNKFISDLFAPLVTVDGAAIKDYEPYALFPMEDPDADANGDNFIKIGKVLIAAFDKFELRDATTGKLTNGYMFGNLLSVLHKHWSSKQMGTCGPMIAAGNEGCLQSSDPTAKFYSPGTNLVSYEQLLGEAFKEEDYIGILARAAVKLKALTVDGKSGTQILAEFVTKLLTPDATLKTRAGATHTKTNLCVETTGPDGMPACTGGIGRIIPVYTPLYLVLDALKGIDDAFAQPGNTDLLDPWHAGRSKLIDQLLTVTRSGAAGAYDYKLADRNAYAIAIAALPWFNAQIDRHNASMDVPAWSDGLSGRLGTILKHPLTAGVVDLLDAFWDETEASGEFTKVSATLLNETDNPDQFRGMLIAATDTLNLLHTDQNLSPAIQFAALGLATNAFDAVSTDGTMPEVETGATSAALQFTKNIVHDQLQTKGDAKYTTLSKLLRNFVVSDGSARSPLEIVFDAVADVNRTMLDAPTEQTLDPDEDRNVLTNVSLFIHDDSQEQRSLERLYQVIQARSLKGQ